MLRKALFGIVVVALAASTWTAAQDGRRMAQPRSERRGGEVVEPPDEHSDAVDGAPVYARGLGGWIYSAWAYRADGEYAIAISKRDVYHRWSDPILIGLDDGLDQVSPALISDDNGNLYLAYTVEQTGQIWMTAKWTGSSAWFAPQQISIGSDEGRTPALEVVNGNVVLAFDSLNFGVRIKNWPVLPVAPTGFQTDGIQEGPDGFPISGLTPTDDGSGYPDINQDRNENTANDDSGTSSTRARTNGRTR